MRHIRSFSSAIVAVFAAPSTVLACTCLASPTFDEVAKDATNVWVVRVDGQGVPAVGDAHGDPVAYIDVELLRVVRGGPAPARVRVWDAMFRSDCPAGLSPLKAGTFAALVVRQATTVEKAELWSLFAARPGIGAYFADGGCAQPWTPLKGEQEAKKYRIR